MEGFRCDRRSMRVVTSELPSKTSRVPLRGTLAVAMEVQLCGAESGLLAQRPAPLLCAASYCTNGVTRNTGQSSNALAIA